MKLLKQIYTILVLLFNVTIHRRHYKLSFVAEHTDMGKLWYYDFKYWGFDHHNLLMVSGADTLCEHYANGKDEVTVDVLASKYPLGVKEGYDHYMAIPSPSDSTWLDKILYGRNYKEELMQWTKKHHFWICPVTLFVLGRYPKHLYIKQK